MTTQIIDEEDSMGFTLTRFWGGKKVMYQITQRYKNKTGSPEMKQMFGHVHVSKEDLEEMLRRINAEK